MWAGDSLGGGGSPTNPYREATPSSCCSPSAGALPGRAGQGAQRWQTAPSQASTAEELWEELGGEVSSNWKPRGGSSGQEPVWSGDECSSGQTVCGWSSTCFHHQRALWCKESEDHRAARTGACVRRGALLHAHWRGAAAVHSSIPGKRKQEFIYLCAWRIIRRIWFASMLMLFFNMRSSCKIIKHLIETVSGCSVACTEKASRSSHLGVFLNTQLLDPELKKRFVRMGWLFIYFFIKSGWRWIFNKCFPLSNITSQQHGSRFEPASWLGAFLHRRLSRVSSRCSGFQGIVLRDSVRFKEGRINLQSKSAFFLKQKAWYRRLNWFKGKSDWLCWFGGLVIAVSCFHSSACVEIHVCAGTQLGFGAWRRCIWSCFCMSVQTRHALYSGVVLSLDWVRLVRCVMQSV